MIKIYQQLQGVGKSSAIEPVMQYKILRSSRPEVLREKGILRNFTKFRGKHLSQNLFFNKVAGI